MVRVQIEMSKEFDIDNNPKYIVRCIKNGKCYFTRVRNDYFDALEIVGWLEDLYKALDINLHETKYTFEEIALNEAY